MAPPWIPPCRPRPMLLRQQRPAPGTAATQRQRTATPGIRRAARLRPPRSCSSPPRHHNGRSSRPTSGPMSRWSCSTRSRMAWRRSTPPWPDGPASPPCTLFPTAPTAWSCSATPRSTPTPWSIVPANWQPGATTWAPARTSCSTVVTWPPTLRVAPLPTCSPRSPVPTWPPRATPPAPPPRAATGTWNTPPAASRPPAS